MTIQYERIFRKVLPVIENKLEEFEYFQYEGITKEDIWNYCVQKKWRKKNIEQLHLYEIVQTIFSLKASEILNHLQIQQLQTPRDWFGSISQDELDELLNVNKKDEENQ